jgi:hypothetical protein
MKLQNNQGLDVTSIGQQTINGIQYEIIELPHVQYMVGLLVKYILVPCKSIAKEVPPNIE